MNNVLTFVFFSLKCKILAGSQRLLAIVGGELFFSHGADIVSVQIVLFSRTYRQCVRIANPVPVRILNNAFNLFWITIKLCFRCKQPSCINDRNMDKKRVPHVITIESLQYDSPHMPMSCSFVIGPYFSFLLFKGENKGTTLISII